MVMTNLGHILANTRIAVDWWATDSTELVNHYFCSHVSSDHTAGLNKEWTCPIYCSEITGKLLRHTCHIAQSLIKPLKFNTPTRIEDSFTVIMLDSNHSMGSAMFLFEGSFGRILYTGNFRWFPELTYPIAKLPIDTVYFDNTHSRKAAKFMTRPECKHYAVSYCRSELSQNKVIYFVLEPIGKEDILSHIAETLGIQVVVSEEKYQLIQCMGLSEYFTIDDQGGKVFCLSKTKFNYKKAVDGILKRHAPSEVKFVKISGMRRGQNCLSYDYIKFCNHSCMKEIELFFASLCYKSASPIMTKNNKDKPVKNSQTISFSPSQNHPDTSISMTNSEPDKIKVKLRKNKDEQTSFTITSEFENAPTLSYRVSSGVTTDEEVGDSPNTSVVSTYLYPGRSCSTPIPNINDEQLAELIIYHDHSSRDSFLSSEIPYNLSFLAGSPERAPYIQPPIPLDWLPSPIKCDSDNTSNLGLDLNVKLDEGLCSLGEELSPDVEDECADSIRSQAPIPKVSPKFVFPRDMQIMCNSPVYNINGRVTYQNTASNEKEQKILSGTDLPLETHKSNVSMLYEEMFKEDEVCLGSIATDFPDDLSDGIEVLNETPDSVETLYVSDTESESSDDIEKAGPIGDYLRGQYALNQMFNSTAINIRETFNSSTFNSNMYKQRKKITEDDLASSRIQLLMPKVNDSHEIEEEIKPPVESDEVRQARYFIESKDEYFRQLSEITKKCQEITYKKKPKKIGRTLPVSRALLSDSINLLNNYADTDAWDPRLRDLAWKLTVDKTVPKSMPVLEIKKQDIVSEVKREDLEKPVAQKHLTLTPGVVKPIKSDKHVSDKKPIVSTPVRFSNSPLVESKNTVCVPRHSTTPKSSKNTKGIPKSSSLIIDESLKKKKRVKTPSSAATPKRQTSNDDIFDMFFGSTPTSLAVKRVKKRSKDPVSRKKINSADSGSTYVSKCRSLVP